MGVWVRWLLLAFGLVLAGCISDVDFPETEGDYIEISAQKGYVSIFAGSFPDWRIYPNDTAYSLIISRNGKAGLRRLRIEGIYRDARRILNEGVLAELARLKQEREDRCRPRPTESGAEPVLVCIEEPSDRSSYRIRVRYSGQTQTYKGYSPMNMFSSNRSAGIFWQTYQKLEDILP